MGWVIPTPTMRRISIGVGVLIIHPFEKKVLVTRRRKGSSWGEGAIAMPGGHIEEFETAYDCAIREIFEETGLVIEPRKIDEYTYVLHAEEWFRQGRHHWTIYMVGDVIGGLLRNIEPDKHEDWRWESLDDLAQTCGQDDWIPVRALLANRKKIGL